MTINDLGAVGSFLASIAVFITLIYLSRQIRQGNMHARAQVRQRMAEHEQQELYLMNTDLEIPKILAKDSLTGDEQLKLHLFLLSAMRQREWEWFQHNDGVISEEVYMAYHGVIVVHLSTEIARKWWTSIGSNGFNIDFINEVNTLLNKTPLSNYYKQMSSFL